MSTVQRPEPPAWLRRWEDLHVGAQIAIVAPLAILLLWAVHVFLLNQPVWRGLTYGVFWGILATAAIVGATRSERARREARRRSAD
ncbi:MAG TPA: hypothetical protein VHK00_09305 [Miltoncostaeaceae bacterium]|nr:hypothetical protein [Miltoncostaeaceae bacterium]